ncbi:hypothetical protein WG954_03800 [Lacibacter sp. H375]|uniref:hypothetical protein n=1 Tax=Lacibacter sp. H375 TaxID=3133424 RepID=UPI0030C1FD14
MKKYLLSMSAVVIAVLLVAFTQPRKSATQEDMYVFEFDHTQSGGYDEANVENESNTYWKYIGKNLSLCDNDPTKACRVAVTSSYVNNPTTPTALSGVTIQATESSTGVAYVTSITDAPSINQLSNKE